MWRRRKRAPPAPSPAPGRIFVGRERELTEIAGLLRSAERGAGGAMLLEGPSGIGKDALLREGRRRYGGELAGARFVEVYCYAATGSQNPYGPFTEALQVLALEADRNPLGETALELIKEHGPDLLGLVPGIGPPLGTLAKVMGSVAGRALGRQAEAEARWKHLPLEFERTLLELAARHAPLVLVIQDAQWMDASSLEVLRRLVRRAPEHPLAILISLLPVGEDHPLRELRREAGEGAAALRLEPLSEEEIARYLEARFGSEADRRIAPWLARRSDGIPLYVSEYVSLLAENGVIATRGNRLVALEDLEAAGERLPGDLREIIARRLWSLDEDARKLLQLSSMQGEQFLTSILAELREEGELEVVAQLEEIERRHGLLAFARLERFAGERSGVYAFESRLMQRALYESVGAYRRLLLHRRITEALGRLIQRDDAASRRWQLELARHHARAEEPLAAVTAYLQAAESAWTDGGLEEAVEATSEALAHSRGLPEGIEEHDRLRARVVLLLVDASHDLRAPEERRDGGEALLALAAEAEAAAARSGDVDLLAQAKYVRAKVLVSARGLNAAVEAFEDAREVAEAGASHLVQLMVLSDLGHHSNSLDLRRGIPILRRAFELHEEDAAAGPAERKLLDRHRARLAAFIGVAEFDDGRYGEAVRRLDQGVCALRDQGARGDLALALAFQAQLQTALGRFEAAEAGLAEAIGLSRESAPLDSRSYCLALLAKLYLEWDEGPERAAAPLEQAVRDSTGGKAISPLITTIRAELGLARGGPDDLDEAERLLREVVDEVGASGFDRSEIAARSLLGRVALRRGDVLGALAESGRAASALEEKGGRAPTVRAEEVFFHHHLALVAGGREEEAEQARRRAVEILAQNAESLSDLELRASLQERVALSRAILAAAGTSPTPAAGSAHGPQ